MDDQNQPASIEVVMKDGVPTLVITLNIIIRTENARSSNTTGNGFTVHCEKCGRVLGSYATRANAARAENAHLRQMHPEIWGKSVARS